MDYTAFQALVASYLHRSDLTSTIPTFIEHGRVRIGDVLRVPEMESTDTITLTNGVGALDANTVAVRSVTGPTIPLIQADPDTIAFLTSESAYCVVGLSIYAPGCATVDAVTWERPVTLLGAAGTETRPLLTAYPTIWLYAALIEAYRYLDDPENELRMQDRFDEEVRRANNRAKSVRYAKPAMNDGVINVSAGGPGL